MNPVLVSGKHVEAVHKVHSAHLLEARIIQDKKKILPDLMDGGAGAVLLYLLDFLQNFPLKYWSLMVVLIDICAFKLNQ